MTPALTAAPRRSCTPTQAEGDRVPLGLPSLRRRLPCWRRQPDRPGQGDRQAVPGLGVPASVTLHDARASGVSSSTGLTRRLDRDTSDPRTTAKGKALLSLCGSPRSAAPRPSPTPPGLRSVRQAAHRQYPGLSEVATAARSRPRPSRVSRTSHGPSGTPFRLLLLLLLGGAGCWPAETAAISCWRRTICVMMLPRHSKPTTTRGQS
jgi:hypothetical protein